MAEAKRPPYCAPVPAVVLVELELAQVVGDVAHRVRHPVRVLAAPGSRRGREEAAVVLPWRRRVLLVVEVDLQVLAVVAGPARGPCRRVRGLREAPGLRGRNFLSTPF